MKYISTRGQTEAVSFSEAVKIGLAPDGGLFLPEKIPDLSAQFKEWERLSYRQLAYEFFRVFATDLDDEALRKRIRNGYKNFDVPLVAPLIRLHDGLYLLELFHGPTLAFKDYALQLLGELYEEQILRSEEPINVLGATSGDTGSAAIHGLLGKEGVNVFITYPDGRISPLQERQMACTGADNVYAMAIDGTFDDCQRIVKEIFGEADYKAQYRLSAVNSINLARILAQCIYYAYAFYQLPEGQRHSVVFNVPTGNFGNVLAGWLVQKMGLPIKGFRVATNQNDILYRLFKTGQYEVSSVAPSHAPSMDIQVASNFERLIYYMENRDPAKVREIMDRFRQNGRYTFSSFKTDTFTASKASNSDIERLIKEVWDKERYLPDPHTACGFAEIDPEDTTIVLGCAHPAKFPDIIKDITGKTPSHPSLEKLKSKELVRHELPNDIEAVKDFISHHAQVTV